MSEAKIVISAVDTTKAAFESAKNNLQGLHTSATAVLGALGALGSVAVFANMIQGSIEAAAGLHDLSIQTGATVEALSALGSVGKLSNTSTETIGSAMNKLAKNMAGATEESKGTGKALEALGINFSTFKKLNPEDQMQAIALAMDNSADGSGKAAVAMALYGKEGAKLLPFLKDLATVGDLQAKVTAEQAAMADNFSDNLTRLQVTGQAWKKELAMGMLPALDLAVQAFTDVMNGTNGMRDGVRKLSADGSLKEWTMSAINGATYVMDAFAGVKRVVFSVGQVLGAVAGMAAESFGAVSESVSRVMKGDFAGAAKASQDATARQKSIWGDLKGTLDATWSEKTLGQQLRDRMGELDKVGVVAEKVKPKIDFTNVLEKNDKAAKDFFSTLAAHIAKEMAGATEALTMGRELSGSEKFRIDTLGKIEEALRKGNINLNQALDLESRMHDAQMKRLEVERMLEKTKSNQAELAEFVKTEEELTAAVVAESKAREQGRQAVSDFAKEIQERNALLQFEVSTMGLSERARNIALDQYRIELDLKKRIAEVNKNPGFDAVQREEESARLTAAANESKTLSSNKVMLDDWKKTTAQYDDIFRKGFADMVNGGTGSWKSFTKSLVTTFKTSVADQIYKMFVQPFFMKIVASVVGLTGGGASGLVSAATESSGGGGVGLNTLSGLTGGANPFTNFGEASLNFLNTAGGKLFNSGFESVGETLIDASNSLRGFTSQISSAGDVLGYAGAVINLSEGKYGAAIGSAVGTYFGGPIGAAIGSFLGGFLDGKGGIASESTGSMARSYDGSGNVTASNSAFAVGNGAAVVDSIYAGFRGIQQSLGGKGGASFDYGSYSGNDNKDPKFRLIGGGFDSGETALNGENYKLAVSRAVFGALQASDLPVSIAKFFKDKVAANLSGADIQSITEAAMAFSNSIKQLNLEFTRLPLAQLQGLTFDATAALVDFSGGLDKLSTNLASYYDNFYSGSERTAQATKNLTADLQSLGINALPATREAYRAQAEALDLTTESGQKTYAGMLALSGAFAQLNPETETASRSIKDIADGMKRFTADITTLEIELARKLSDSSGADALQFKVDTKGLSAAELGLFNYVAALKTQIAAVDAATVAAEKATAAQQAIASQREGLDTRLLQLQGNTVELRNRELAAILPTNQALQLFIYTLEDAATASAAAAAVAVAGAASRDARLGAANTAVDEARAAVERITAAQQQSAATALKATQQATQQQVASMRAITDLLSNSVRDLYGEVDSTRMQAAGQANAFIDNALSNAQATGYLPDAKELGEAIQAARAGIDANNFATQNEFVIAQLLLAGKLDQLKGISGRQLTEAERAQASADAQTTALEGILGATTGTQSGVLTLADAMAQLTAALKVQEAAQIAKNAGNTKISAADIRSFIFDQVNDTSLVGETKIYNAAKANGISSMQLEQAMGWKPGIANEWAKANGLPAFADGGMHAGGWAMVGERGPEMAYMPPARIYSASDTRSMQGAGVQDTARLERLVEGLTEEVTRLRAQVSEGNQYARRTAEATNGNGDRAMRTEVVPS